jgi:TonB family protein
MKRTALPRIKSASRRLFPFLLLASLIFSLTAVFQTGQAQQLPLTLADILTGLRSKKVTLADRNKLLTEAVKKRGVTFTLTAEIEKELEITGADKDFIETIRQKGPITKAAPVVPAATAAKPAPGPTPAPSAAAPPDFTFYQNRANARFVKGEYDLAVVDYNKVIELNSKDASTYFYRAMAYYNKKAYGLAIADYNKAIELDPKDSMLHLNRGDSYEKIGNLQMAAEDYRKAVELDAENETAKSNLKRLQSELAKNLPEPKKPEISSAPVAAASAPSSVSETAVPAQPVELGQLNNLALSLAMPTYPEIARKSGIQGMVSVRVILNEEGKVISAKATSGQSLLRFAGEAAAMKSKFKPTLVRNQAVKSTGFIVYNFVNKF